MGDINNYNQNDVIAKSKAKSESKSAPNQVGAYSVSKSDNNVAAQKISVKSRVVGPSSTNDDDNVGKMFIFLKSFS